MAFTSAFFDAELVNGEYDREYSAEHFAEYFASFIANGVFPDPATNLQVVANTVNDMNVLVSTGMGWINGYYCKNDGSYPLAIQAANGTLNRIDAVVIGWSQSDRTITAYVKTGVAASAPTAPSLERSADRYELMLATIMVNAGVTKITQSMITDKRPDSSVCGWVAGVVQQIDATNLFAQYDATFQTWFEDIQSQLSGDVATNLQNQINQANNRINSLSEGLDNTNTELSSLGNFVNQNIGLIKNSKGGLKEHFNFFTFAVAESQILYNQWYRISPDRTKLVVSNNNVISLYNLETGEITGTVSLSSTPLFLDDDVLIVGYSPSSNTYQAYVYRVSDFSLSVIKSAHSLTAYSLGTSPIQVAKTDPTIAMFAVAQDRYAKTMGVYVFNKNTSLFSLVASELVDSTSFMWRGTVNYMPFGDKILVSWSAGTNNVSPITMYRRTAICTSLGEVTNIETISGKSGYNSYGPFACDREGNCYGGFTLDASNTSYKMAKFSIPSAAKISEVTTPENSSPPLLWDGVLYDFPSTDYYRIYDLITLLPTRFGGIKSTYGDWFLDTTYGIRPSSLGKNLVPFPLGKLRVSLQNNRTLYVYSNCNILELGGPTV